MCDKAVHKWEHAGHGRAPFRCVGVYSYPSKALAEANPTAYQAALAEAPRGFGIGSCRICGMPLTHNYLIVSADGRQFSVGCDCVEKRSLDDRNLTTQVRELRLAAEREKREAKRMARWQAREAQIQARQVEERKRNRFGLTDEELERIDRDHETALRIDQIRHLGLQLQDGKGGFCDSVAREILNDGQLPRGNGLSIMIGILAKQAGRRGSRAFEEEYTRLELELDVIT